VELVTGGRTSPRASWWWHHPDLHAAIAAVRGAPRDESSDLERLAGRSGLSTERLTDVLDTDLGHTATSYIRWVTLMSALERWADGEPLTGVGHADRVDGRGSFAEELRSGLGLPLAALVGSRRLSPR
jgi:hypothetical protein